MAALCLSFTSCGDDDESVKPTPEATQDKPTPEATQDNTSEADGLVAVDLGLPSGTKWANMNVGAEKPEDYGLYFSWGETESYNSNIIWINSNYGRMYDAWVNYELCSGSGVSLTKYNIFLKYGQVDNKLELDLEDDAAFKILGNEWRMPSKAQIQELLNSSYTTNELITKNGVKGHLITSKTNGKSIFIPMGGSYSEGSLSVGDIGVDGGFWSRTLSLDDTRYAYGITLRHNTLLITSRPSGLNIRAIKRS